MVEVILREIGLRDGLQMVTGDLPTSHKIAWLHAEVAAGVKEIEVTSFVPASGFPIFADAKQIVAAALAIPGLSASALTPNVRGAELAFQVGIRKLNYVVSASAAHSRVNVRRTIDEAIDDFARIVALRDALRLDRPVELSCGIATAFGCTIQGEVSEDLVVDIARRLVSLGAGEIMIADTVGYATPSQVERVLAKVLTAIGNVPLAAHFHDTRGLGLANVAAAVRTGVRRFDASMGGLGGCPHAPGASGNVDFIDTAFLLDSLGLATGVDYKQLIALRDRVAAWLPSEHLTGAIAKAGLPKKFARHP